MSKPRVIARSPRRTTVSVGHDDQKHSGINSATKFASMSHRGEISSIQRIGGQSLIIEISDTGHGIAPKDLPHIFEPFFTKKEKGTGLGLAITQGIIEKHGGKIIVESTLNKGTKFKIEIPIKTYRCENDHA